MSTDAAVLSATPSAPPSYAATIRAEIAADVRKLIGRCHAELRGWRDADWRPIGRAEADVHPRYLKLGYTVAMHQGQDLYRDGDMIEGLVVSIDRWANRSITVYGDYAWFETDGWDDIEDESRVVEDERRVQQTITW